MDLKMTVTPRELKPLLTSLANEKNPPTVFLWGQPGIGKSQIIEQLGEEMKIPVTTTILSLMDPIEMKGLLVYDKDEKKADFVPLKILPQGKSIWFLDEIVTAPPSVLNTTLRVIQEKWLGNTKIPDDCFIVMASNRNKDKVTPFKLSSAFVNRSIHISLEPSFEDWKHWAYSNNIRPEVIAYIEMAPNDFVHEPRTDYPFATPRSWEKVSDMLKYNNDVLISGLVGEDVSTKFSEFRKNAFGVKEMLNDIYKGKFAYPKESEVGKSFIISSVLPTKHEKDNVLENVIKYCVKAPNHWNPFSILTMKNLLINTTISRLFSLPSVKKDLLAFNEKFTQLKLFD